MCLTIYKIDKPTSEKAKEDIVCYKVLLFKKGDDGKTEYITPIMLEKVEIGKTLRAHNTRGPHRGKTKKMEPKCTGLARFAIDVKEWIITQGAFHVFADKTDAYHFMDARKKMNALKNQQFPVENPCYFCVAECIIPKGTEYYDGWFEYGFISKPFHSYAASAIKIEKTYEYEGNEEN